MHQATINVVFIFVIAPANLSFDISGTVTDMLSSAADHQRHPFPQRTNASIILSSLGAMVAAAYGNAGAAYHYIVVGANPTLFSWPHI